MAPVAIEEKAQRHGEKTSCGVPDHAVRPSAVSSGGAAGSGWPTAVRRVRATRHVAAAYVGDVVQRSKAPVGVRGHRPRRPHRSGLRRRRPVPRPAPGSCGPVVHPTPEVAAARPGCRRRATLVWESACAQQQRCGPPGLMRLPTLPQSTFRREQAVVGSQPPCVTRPANSRSPGYGAPNSAPGLALLPWPRAHLVPAITGW